MLLLLLGAELGYLNHMCQCAEEEPRTIVVVNWRVSCLHKQTRHHKHAGFAK
jgi:hypothetical protein